MARLYDGKWSRYSKSFLKSHPFCVYHLERGQYVAATVVDHITPHKGNQKLFWSTCNHQALCKHCHDSIKKRFEMTGKLVGHDATGQPLDKNHHWNK